MTTHTEKPPADRKKADPAPSTRSERDRDDDRAPPRPKPNEDLKGRADWFQQRRGGRESTD